MPSVSTAQLSPVLKLKWHHHLTQPKGFFPIRLSTPRLMGQVTRPCASKYNLSKFLSFVMKLICSHRTIDGWFKNSNYSLYIMSLQCSVMQTFELTFLSTHQFRMFSAGGSQTTWNITTDKNTTDCCFYLRYSWKCLGACHLFLLEIINLSSIQSRSG